jgi:hypothetical protein
MEKEGLPNAGLHDQRAVFQWVQDYIYLLRGDPSNVSAWGESAGGGSIFTHLVAGRGTIDPLFHRAIAMSPGFLPFVDGTGAAEMNFQVFAAAVGCGGQGVECLRQADVSTLIHANIDLDELVWAPVPDREFIFETPVVEVAAGMSIYDTTPYSLPHQDSELTTVIWYTGNYWKDLDSLIVSHVEFEGLALTPSPLPDTFIDLLMTDIFPPDSSSLISQILDSYSAAYPQLSTLEFAYKIIGDIFIRCNVGSMVEAYPDRTYLLQYSFPPATHGSDLEALFYSFAVDQVEVPVFMWYQSYFVSHAITGNPNTFRHTTRTIEWPLVPNANAVQFGNTLNVTEVRFELIQDSEVNKSLCSLWREAFTSARSAVAS